MQSNVPVWSNERVWLFFTRGEQISWVCFVDRSHSPEKTACNFHFTLLGWRAVQSHSPTLPLCLCCPFPPAVPSTTKKGSNFQHWEVFKNSHQKGKTALNTPPWRTKWGEEGEGIRPRLVRNLYCVFFFSPSLLGSAFCTFFFLLFWNCASPARECEEEGGRFSTSLLLWIWLIPFSALNNLFAACSAVQVESSSLTETVFMALLEFFIWMKERNERKPIKIDVVNLFLLPFSYERLKIISTCYTNAQRCSQKIGVFCFKCYVITMQQTHSSVFVVCVTMPKQTASPSCSSRRRYKTVMAPSLRGGRAHYSANREQRHHSFWFFPIK